MLIRPQPSDIKLVGFQLGRVLYVVGIAGIIPLVWAVIDRDWHSASSFIFMIGLALAIAASVERFRPKEEHAGWHHGMVTVALVWLVVPALGAIPLALSRHYGRPLDAFFDAMSGVTTTGLALIQDVDHLASSINVWRSALQFLGGQGIVLAALMFFGGGGVLALYHGEARDERIFPSVGSTARFIWSVSLFHAVFGITALWAVGSFILGFHPMRSLLHAITIFMSAFDTGGFAPMSTSIGYYHSVTYESVIGVLMVAGALSFGAHYALWRGPRNLLRNLEARTILTTFAGTLVIALIGLAATGLYTDGLSLGRQGFFQLLSAHTGTGFSTVPPADLIRWSGLAFGGITIAMALGGMGSSTAGGVKALRIGLTVRSLWNTVKEALLPEGSVISNRYSQGSPKVLHPELAQSVMTISLLYVGLYLLGTAVGIAYGVPLQQAMFESVSAGASVGLSVGVVDPTMPVFLELVYVLQMWIGRLEFVAVFALVGFVVSWVVGE